MTEHEHTTIASHATKQYLVDNIIFSEEDILPSIEEVYLPTDWKLLCKRIRKVVPKGEGQSSELPVLMAKLLYVLEVPESCDVAVRSRLFDAVQCFESIELLEPHLSLILKVKGVVERSGLVQRASMAEAERILLLFHASSIAFTDTAVVGLFPHFGCFKHSCNPNCLVRSQASVNAQGKEIAKPVLIAARTIQPGEPLTVTALLDSELRSSVQNRALALQARRGIRCTSPCCSQETPDLFRRVPCPNCADGLCFAAPKIVKWFGLNCGLELADPPVSLAEEVAVFKKHAILMSLQSAKSPAELAVTARPIIDAARKTFGPKHYLYHAVLSFEVSHLFAQICSGDTKPPSGDVLQLLAYLEDTWELGLELNLPAHACEDILRAYLSRALLAVILADPHELLTPYASFIVSLVDGKRQVVPKPWSKVAVSILQLINQISEDETDKFEKMETVAEETRAPSPLLTLAPIPENEPTTEPALEPEYFQLPEKPKKPNKYRWFYSTVSVVVAVAAAAVAVRAVRRSMS
jgi:hypothetical protein